MNSSASVGEHLLTTKFFIPPSSRTLIARPRLTMQISESQQQKLTLVSAPAGFGKTTLIAAWVHSLPPGDPQVAWVSLDEGDNDPLRFWAYALTALDACQPGLCAPLLTFLQTEQSPSIDNLLTALINIFGKQTEEFLLILDDYHVITEPTIHTSLSFLLERLPSQLHLILATRTDPPLSLSRLRARDQVLAVRSEQLRCTPEETSAFFSQTMGITLTSEEVHEVEDRTEGWMVGIQLLALSMRGHAGPATILRGLNGSQRYILDYLTDEVLQQQPAAVRTFLLRTSILERLHPSLCDSVMQQSGSQQMLERLEQANLFVTSLDGRQWYRYDALFAEALYYRLEQTEGEDVPSLHLRASRWFAGQGYLNEAVRHAMSARDWSWAADLLEQVYALLWSSNEHTLVRRLLEKIPVEQVRSRPRLCLAYARILFLATSYTMIELWLQVAETALRTALPASSDGAIKTGVLLSSEQEERDNLLGEIASYRAAITAFNLGDGRSTLAYCQQALAYLSEQNLVARAEVAYAQSLAYHALGEIVAAVQSAREATALAQAVGNISPIITYICRTAYSLLVQGKLHEVAQVAQQVALLGTTAVGLPHAMVCWAYIFHADILREWNRLDEALEFALKGIQLSAQTETIVALYLGHTVQMRIYLARGEMDEARLAFQRSEATLAKTYSTYRRDVTLIVDWMQFWLASGDAERVTRWVQELVERDGMPSPLAREREDVARARMLLAQQKLAEALSLLEPLQSAAEKQERWRHVIEMKVLQALAHHMLGEKQAAQTVLTQAVYLAEAEGYIRVFVDEGAPMAGLLSLLAKQQREQKLTAYLDTLLVAFRQESNEQKRQLEKARQHATVRPLLDPLSKRELELLQLVAQGASNPQIAEELVISVDTVKHHVYKIYLKLGVKNRIKALSRARDLGLIFEEL